MTVWGAQAENCAQYLAKGRPVAVDGRLEWRQYTTQDGQKREAVEVIADSVQFLAGREQSQRVGQRRGLAAIRAGDTGDFDRPLRRGPAPVSDDDIPF